MISINPTFSFTLPSHNIYSDFPSCPDTKPGIYSPAVSGGYYLMPAPLPPDSHTIHFEATAPSLNFTVNLTYNLTVQAR